MINGGHFDLPRGMSKGFVLVLVFCAFWLTSRVQAAPVHQELVVGQVQVWEDRSATATLDQILAQRAQFTDLHTDAPNYGFTGSAYWLRIPVKNPDNVPSRFYLDIKNSGLDYVTLYVVGNATLHETIQSGDTVPINQRPYLATTLVLPFHLAGGAAAELYVRVQSNGAALFVPFEVLAEKAIQSAVAFGWVLHSLFLGIIGALFIYNLFIFSLLRTRLYLYYILYLPVIYLVLAGISGFGPTYLYPGYTWLGNAGVGFFTGIALALLLLMTRAFLLTSTHIWLDRSLQIGIMGAFVFSGGVFVWSPRFGYQLTAGTLFFFPLFCFAVGVIAWRLGRTEARFYIIGQITSWVSMVLFALLNTGVLPYHFLIYQSPAFGIASDALLLSLALADQIRLLQRARMVAEDLARKNLEIRQEELERLVAERTAEIKTLHGILPICANCKKIRDEEGAWQGLETYISQHTDAQFSHGICTDCMKSLYPTIYQKRQ
jgi:hypothetical protein